MSTLKVAIVSGVVALAVAVVVILSFLGAQSPSTGYSQSDVGKFPEGALVGDYGERYKSISIPLGVDQTSYRNTSGRDQYVDLAVLRTTGTASTTQSLGIGTSTSATVNTLSVPQGAKSFLSQAVATGTPAHTFNSAAGTASLSTYAGGVIRVPDGVYLNIVVYQTFASPCTGSLCETSTSTNRGFAIDGLIRVLQKQ